MNDIFKKYIQNALESATVKVSTQSGFKGTGFFITKDGYILTAWHCIKEIIALSFSDVTVYYDEQTFPAQLDQDKSVEGSDIAILKIDYLPKNYLPLGLIQKEHKGQEVVAVGYPAAYIEWINDIGVYPGTITRLVAGEKQIEIGSAIQGMGQSGGLVYHYDSQRVIGMAIEVFKEGVMKNAGLAVRFEALFKKWPSLFVDIEMEIAKTWENCLDQFLVHIEKESSSKPSNQKVDIYHLPNPANQLVGRTPELAKIDNAFNDLNTHIIGIIAVGGIGKSALVDAWLKGLEARNYNGVVRVFGWSFYSQGTHDTQTSSGPFFEQALPFFGEDLSGFGNLTGLPLTDEAKGRRLAELLREQSSLLMLDGVEPLQNRAVVDGGRLKDNGLYALLRDVSRHGLGENSLVVVSSRQPLVELEKCPSYQMVDLQRLSTADGVMLLKSLQVEGLPNEFATAVEAYGGHALALVLLGNLLVAYFAGDVNQHERLPIFEESDEAVVGHHAERVMGFYDRYWADDRKPNFWEKIGFVKQPLKHEQIFLYLLGLFDRPMDMTALKALLKQAKFARPLAKLSKKQWNIMLVHLRKTGLLLEEKRDFVEESYDTHPLIRSYFRKQLQVQNPSAWRQAHLVLFEFFQTVPAKHQPDTLEELEPLYQAVVHGYMAGEYKKAREDVYRERIRRGNEGYSLKKLGAFSQDLTAIAAFFPEGWEKPVGGGLSEVVQGWWLAEASFCLMSLGRLAEAVALRRATVKLFEELEAWKHAAATARNLVDLSLPIGQLSEAKQTAQQAIEFADRSDNQFSQIRSSAYLATTLHQQRNLEAALKQFEIAEKIQHEREPEYPKLYSLGGAWYCALLLDLVTDMVARKTVLDRGRYMEKASIDLNFGLLSIAFDHLTIARVLFAMNRFDQASDEFDQAVSGIRKAGRINDIPVFLLERAKCHRQQKYFKQSQTDLDESQEIIDRCGMKLYAVDAALLRGNLNLDQNKTAQTEYETAKELLEKTGYHLRDGELEELRIRNESH